MNKFSNDGNNSDFIVVIIWGCFLAFAVSLFSGCLECVDIQKINTPKEPWVLKSSLEAVSYWDDHGVSFEFVKDGGIEISVKNDLMEQEAALGVYTAGKIYLDPSLNSKEETRRDENVLIEMGYTLQERNIFYHNLEINSKMCVISHELGHALGMGHTEDGSHLMAPHLNLCVIMPTNSDRDICCWSEEDEQELAGVQIEEEN